MNKQMKQPIKWVAANPFTSAFVGMLTLPTVARAAETVLESRAVRRLTGKGPGHSRPNLSTDGGQYLERFNDTDFVTTVMHRDLVIVRVSIALPASDVRNAVDRVKKGVAV